MNGEINFYTDFYGKEIALIGLETGYVTIPKAMIQKVEYPEKKEADETVRDDAFHRALRNTVSLKGGSKRPPALYDPYIRMASRKNRLDPDLIKAVIQQESGFHRKGVSRKGAKGLMQLMPETAKDLGVKDAFDPWENIQGGTRYLRMMLENFDGDLVKALAAYNAGPNAVRKYNSVPPYRETQGYVRKVLHTYRLYRGSKLYAFEDARGHLVVTDKPYLP